MTILVCLISIFSDYVYNQIKSSGANKICPDCKEVKECGYNIMNDGNLMKEAMIRSCNNLIRDLFTLIGLIVSMI